MQKGKKFFAKFNNKLFLSLPQNAGQRFYSQKISFGAINIVVPSGIQTWVRAGLLSGRLQIINKRTQKTCTYWRNIFSEIAVIGFQERGKMYCRYTHMRIARSLRFLTTWGVTSHFYNYTHLGYSLNDLYNTNHPPSQSASHAFM